MKNERRNAQTKATHQNTEPVWDATGRAQRHPLDEYQHSLWAGQKNQDRPQRKRRRDPAPTHRKGRRPARNVLGQASPADAPDATQVTIVGVVYDVHANSGRFVTSTPFWHKYLSNFTILSLHGRLSLWKDWCRGGLNLRERYPGERELVPTSRPAGWSRAPQVS